jgi:hypothetical protein
MAGRCGKGYTTPDSRFKAGRRADLSWLVSDQLAGYGCGSPGTWSRKYDGKPKEEGGDEGERDELIYQRVE